MKCQRCCGHEEATYRVPLHIVKCRIIGTFYCGLETTGSYRAHALDHGNAHPALACSPPLIGDWTSLSGAVQIVSGSD